MRDGNTFNTLYSKNEDSYISGALLHRLEVTNHVSLYHFLIPKIFKSTKLLTVK